MLTLLIIKAVDATGNSAMLESRADPIGGAANAAKEAVHAIDGILAGLSKSSCADLWLV